MRGASFCNLPPDFSQTIKKFTKMNKNDLIRRISERNTISMKEAAKYVNTVLGAIGDMLAEKETVTIPDFGRFYVRTVPEHEAMNPATRERVNVPEKDRIAFKAFKRIKAYSFIN